MYNPDVLEEKIDKFRMDGDWNGVLKSVEKYAHVFAVGAAVHSKQHENLEQIRAYYWTVMAELMLEKKHDYLKAFGCVKRSSEIGPQFVDWRIMLVRVLLGRTHSQKTESQLRRNSVLSPNSPIRNYSEKSDTISVCDTLSIVDPAEYDPGVMLDGVLHNFSATERRALLHIVSSSPLNYKNAVLAALSILPSAAVLSICTLVLHQSHEVVPSNRGDIAKYSNEELINTWILSTCEHVLRPVSAQDIMSRYLAGSLSEYRLWLYMDAIAARSTIQEILGDLPAARKDLLHLLKMVMSTPSLDEKSISTAPLACMNILTYSACRLGLLEHSIAFEHTQHPQPPTPSTTAPAPSPVTSKHKSLDSLLNCIKDNFSLYAFLPHCIRVGILVECALLYLEKAQGWSGVNTLGEWRKGSGQTTGDGSMGSGQTTGDGSMDDNIVLFLDAAYMLLGQAHILMSDVSTGAHESIIIPRYAAVNLATNQKKHATVVRNNNDLNPISQSLIWLLPEADTNPLKLNYSSSTRLIALLLASLTSIPAVGGLSDVSTEKGWDCGAAVTNDNRMQKVVQLLEWGLACELSPPPHFLQALGMSQALASTNSEETLAVFEQAHNITLSIRASNSNISPAELNPHVLIDNSLMSQLEDEHKVVKVLHWVNKDLYSQKLNTWKPLLAAANILGFELYDYKRAISYLHQGLLDVFIEAADGADGLGSYNIGHQIMKYSHSLDMLESYDRTDDRAGAEAIPQSKMFLLHTQPVSDILKCSNNSKHSSAEDESVKSNIVKVLLHLSRTNGHFLCGVCEVLMCVAKCHVWWARFGLASSSAICWAIEQEEHRKVAIKIFDVLLSAGVEVSSDFYVDLAIVLAEIGQATEAMNIIEKGLRIPFPYSRNCQRNLLHIKLLLVTSGGQYTAGQDCIQQLKEAGLVDSNVELSILSMEVGSAPIMNRPNSYVQKVTNIQLGICDVPLPEGASECKRSAVTRLLTIASLFVQLCEFSKAKGVLDQVWGLLYETPKNASRPSGGAGVREDELHALDTLRLLPSLVGWRLSSGSGFGDIVTPDMLDLVADVLYGCAGLMRTYHAYSSNACTMNTSNMHVDGLSGSIEQQKELLQFALMLYPRHTQTLLLLAEIELESVNASSKPKLMGQAVDINYVDLFDESKVHMDASRAAVCDANVNKALKYAIASLQINRRDFHGWFMYGKCLEELGQIDRARYAYVTALEFQREGPWRSFADVALQT